MMNQQTMDKLKEMRLNGLAAAWLEQQSRPDYGGLTRPNPPTSRGI